MTGHDRVESRVGHGEDDDVTATVTGPAWDLELWLWGRRSADGLAVEGDQATVDRLRAVVVDSTQ